MSDIERCLLVKQEVFVYKIPPRQSARGYRAADWSLTSPDWTGRLRIMEANKKVRLKLEDKGSGELFAACPVDAYPGAAVEAVTDSSRYFVIKIVDEGGRSAFIGMGFSDRADSFDLNVTLQDHFQGVKKEEKISQESHEPQPQLDLAFKEGQTIKVNINIPKGDKVKTAKTRTVGGILPPPPAGMIKPPPSASKTASVIPGAASLTPLTSPVSPTAQSVIGGSSSVDLLCLGGLDLNTPAPEDPWGDFASAEDSGAKASGNWVQF